MIAKMILTLTCLVVTMNSLANCGDLAATLAPPNANASQIDDCCEATRYACVKELQKYVKQPNDYASNSIISINVLIVPQIKKAIGLIKGLLSLIPGVVIGLANTLCMALVAAVKIVIGLCTPNGITIDVYITLMTNWQNTTQNQCAPLLTNLLLSLIFALTTLISGFIDACPKMIYKQ